ncbi:MAG: aldehyde dehydrogenase family protein [Acidimicrobiia bacterium]|nr:aldehyde dehydrogenase family protein [Acidimicrobiia bacterium]
MPEGLPIAGHWRQTIEKAAVVFPYDGSVVAQAPVGSPDDAATALDTAESARKAVASLPTHERRRCLNSVADELAGRTEELIDLLILETGKPRRDCVTEVTRSIITFRMAAEECARVTGETVPLDLLPSGEGMFGFWVREPIGVVVGITGFNYPLLLASHKIAPAMGVGCPIIVKPAPNTPLATLFLTHLIQTVGYPADGVQVVTGDAAVGETLTTDTRVRAVSFTGSAAVGYTIAKNVGAARVTLELGSNAALVVTGSADLARAANAVARGGYYASGQACISVQRIIAEESIAGGFTAFVADRVKSLVVGDPRHADTDVAPLINRAATDRVTQWIDQALVAGAEVVTGGQLGDDRIEPTVVRNVADGQPLWDEEVFGPVVAIREVPDLDAAIDVVNRSRFGLHVSIFTSDIASAVTVARRIEAGGILINEVPGFRADNMPYGGVKHSGMGREGPRFAMEEFTVTKMIMVRP